ncbi:SDR family oxidoreductase [Flammeovirgaceae bacterium SG7u.111]|nr:SDR family oxidoreductase [Flammeovirgaceae bacterium SG7u.132]WPO37513.1 SDR family oxidoreductase [Flammeovirgaceae bacterium SG7u.111]
MKTIFMTGTSTGLGKAAALLFAEKGWKVIATMRNPSKAEDLTNHPNIQLMALDVTNAKQIIEVAEKATSLGKIDVVFNNAGYGLAGPFEGTSDDQILRNINTNLVGVMRVVRAFLPYFRSNRAGLFLTTTSVGGSIALPFNSVYHATKFALEGWSESMDLELRKFGIGIKTIAPGGIKTDFASRSLDMSQHEAYNEIFEKVAAIFRDPKRAESWSSPETIAELVYEAATDGKDQLRYYAGVDAKAFVQRKEEIGYKAFRDEIDQMFFGS